MVIFNKERALTPSWNLLNPSFELVKKYVWHIVYLSFAPALLVAVGTVMIGDITKTQSNLTDSQGVGIFILLTALIWTLLVTPGFVYFQAQAVRGKSPGVMESFQAGLKRLLPFVGLSLLSTLLVILGLIAFIFPGLIMIRGFYLAAYYVVDQNMGPVEALKQSYADSKPVAGWIWGTIGVMMVFVLIGSFFSRIAIIGSLLSILLTYPYIFGQALRYGEITERIKVKLT